MEKNYLKFRMSLKISRFWEEMVKDFVTAVYNLKGSTSKIV